MHQCRVKPPNDCQVGWLGHLTLACFCNIVIAGVHVSVVEHETEGFNKYDFRKYGKIHSWTNKYMHTLVTQHCILTHSLKVSLKYSRKKSPNKDLHIPRSAFSRFYYENILVKDHHNIIYAWKKLTKPLFLKYSFQITQYQHVIGRLFVQF